MFDRINLRWLALSVVVIGLVAGGIYGASWWINRPEYLLESAQKYYERGEEAEKRNDPAAAMTAYESADKQLLNYFGKPKPPRVVEALTLRNRVLSQLALLYAQEEAEAEKAGRPMERRSAALYPQIWTCLERAAEMDSTNAEAQTKLMMNFLYQDQIVRASAYALRVAALKPGANSDGDWPTYHADKSAAHFILAWMAIHHFKPPRPDDALDNLKKGAEAEAQAHSNKDRQSIEPRWRAVALEAYALAIQVEDQRLKLPAARRTQGSKEVREAAEQVRGKLGGWLARARKELAEPVPPVPVSLPGHVHTVASMAVRSSPTDVPGLLDVLMLGVQYAADPLQVLDRADLAIAVCEKLTSTEQTPELVRREVAKRLAQLPDQVVRRTNHLVFVEKHPSTELPRSKTWASLRERIDRVAERTFDREGIERVTGYLRLAQSAQRDGRHEPALAYARRAAESLEHLKKVLAADAPVEVKARVTAAEGNWHAITAWSHLVRNQPAEAAPHLAALRHNADKALAGQARLMDGLAALKDGRLEQAVRELEQARQYPRIGDSLYPALGLAYAYMAMGKYDRALTQLQRVRIPFDHYDKLTPDEKAFADWLLPNPAALNLEFFRCQLGLGNLREAMAYKEALGDLPEGQTATAHLVQFYLTQNRLRQKTKGREVPAGVWKTDDILNYYTELARQGAPAATDDPWLDAARRELNSARKMAPDETYLAVSEADLLLTQPESNRPLVASALAALALSPANLGVHVTENLRLRKGLAWHAEKAETLLRTHAYRYRDVASMLAWAQWLGLNGRIDEANNLLTQLEETATEEHKRRIRLHRAQLLLARGPSPEVARLVEALETNQPDLHADLLSIYYASAVEKNPAEAEKKLATALGRHHGSGLLHYWQGQMAEARGDYKQAVRAYDRAVQFTAVRGLAQRGLLVSLLNLSLHESPAAANELAAELLRVRPDEPALLLAFAETALLLDNIYGSSGMEGSLRALDGILRENGQSPALGPYFLARGWAAARRPDLARKELDRALSADPRHRLSLELAGELAFTAEDWSGTLQYAAALEAVVPDSVEAMRWRIAALDNLGRATEAMKACQNALSRFPDQAAGYLGIARVLEKNKDYDRALTWLAAWLERKPDDTTALQVRVKLLVLAGRIQEVNPLAEQVLARPQPTASDEERARREADVAMNVTLGFITAQALDRAEEWALRAATAARRLPAKYTDEAVTAEQLLGDVYIKRGLREPPSDLRKTFLNKAIDQYRLLYEKVPGHLLAGNNLAWLLAQERGEPEAALAVVEQMRQGKYSRKPVSGDRLPLDVLDTMGEVYRGAGRYRDAVELFSEASQRYPDEPRVFLHLGRSYAGLKEYRAALDSLTRASRLATEQADGITDPRRRAELQAVADEARRDQLKLQGK